MQSYRKFGLWQATSEDVWVLEWCEQVEVYACIFAWMSLFVFFTERVAQYTSHPLWLLWLWTPPKRHPKTQVQLLKDMAGRNRPDEHHFTIKTPTKGWNEGCLNRTIWNNVKNTGSQLFSFFFVTWLDFWLMPFCLLQLDFATLFQSQLARFICKLSFTEIMGLLCIVSTINETEDSIFMNRVTGFIHRLQRCKVWQQTIHTWARNTRWFCPSGDLDLECISSDTNHALLCEMLYTKLTGWRIQTMYYFVRCCAQSWLNEVNSWCNKCNIEEELL